MARLFLDERELRAAGIGEPTIRTLRKLTEFVETQEALSAAQGAIDANADDISDLAANDVILAAADSALDLRIDAYDALAPFVRQNQAANPAHTPYAGQVISNPPTQAEVEAIDDALINQSTTIATLLTRLDTVNLLT